MMKIDILTLFPEMFQGPFDISMIEKAQRNGAVAITVHNLRKWATDKHSKVDDRPFGGGKGMVIKVDVVDNALIELRKDYSKVLMLSPQGKVFSQPIAQELAKLEHIILLAGHYEGFDERINEHLVDEEISIGNYVLTGGELPAMVVTDAIVRLLPGVLDAEATLHETHSKPGHYDFPQYTHPREYKGWGVPEVLFTGDHLQIKKWRLIESKKKELLKK